jgi:hypothetical protein
MSNAMKSRLRGRPVRSVSGRLLHLTFGDGTNPAEDQVRTHVCACYGISGGSGMRKNIAEALHEELEAILSNAEYAARGDHFIVYADVNAVEHGGDRATGETTSYDDDEHALWRALSNPTHGLQDLMAAAYAVPPMTYAPKNKPTSRIDLLFASAAIAAKAHAATASSLGSLSATHLPLACSFSDDGLAGVPQDLHSEGALDSAVAIMATVGGRRWAFGPAEKSGTKYYHEKAFQEPEIQSRLVEADRQLKEAENEAWDDLKTQLLKTQLNSPTKRGEVIETEGAWTCIQAFLGQPNLENEAKGKYFTELTNITLRAEEMTRNHLKEVFDSLNPPEPPKPQSQVKPSEQYPAQRASYLLTRLRNAMQKPSSSDHTKLWSDLHAFSEEQPLQMRPPPKTNNLEDWAVWVNSVRATWDQALAFKRYFNNHSATGRTYKQQNVGDGRKQVVSAKDAVRAAKGQVGGMADGLERDGEVIATNRGLAEHVRQHQQH